MRFKSRFFKISLVLGILIVLFVVSMLWQERGHDGRKPSGMGISLVRPAFAQEDGVSFLEQEAGIAAYTNVGQRINLTKTKEAFRILERETGEYIIGSVPLSGYAETDDVHAYVHKDGWVVVYYIKDEPAAKILDWNDYGEDEKINGTKLEIGMVVICSAASTSVRDVKYHDFRYPDASRMMIVAEAIWNEKREDTFRIKLPSDSVFYERSYSFFYSGYANNTVYVDAEQIIRSEFTGGKRSTLYAWLSPTQLSLDVFHTIKVYNNGGRIVLFSIVLVYRES